MLNFKKYYLPASTLLAIAVGIVGVVISGIYALQQRSDIYTLAREEFDRSADRLAREIDRRFSLPLYGLTGSKALFISSQSVTRKEFQRSITTHNLAEEFPGVRGLGFIQRVEKTELNNFLEKQRRDQAPTFALHQLDDTSQADHLIVTYIEPAATNAGALGLDIGSEIKRRTAAQKAIDTGLARMTAGITLVQDQKKTPGVLVFLPIYHEGKPLNTIAERRQALLGLSYATIVINELINEIPDVISQRIDFNLYDSATHSESNFVLYDADQHSKTTQYDTKERLFHTSRVLQIHGRELLLHVNSVEAVTDKIDKIRPVLSFIVGTLLSILIALSLWRQNKLRQRAESIAERMTSEFDRLAQVVKHSSDAILFTDLDLKITWVNEGFNAATGYSAAQAIGQTVDRFIGDLADPNNNFSSLIEVLGPNSELRKITLNQNKDKEAIYFETEIQLLNDRAGKTIGYLFIASNITSQQHTRIQLENALRDSDALLSTLNKHTIFSFTDQRGRILDVNNLFCQISGYTREELLRYSHNVLNSGTHSREF